MRVIAGEARGVPLKGPMGPGTRATSDKVRGAIFNVLAPYIVDARVLDLYAGTGALGIEALSRGAASCLFVERVPSVCRVIEANLAATRQAERGRVWCMGVVGALDRLEAGRDDAPSEREAHGAGTGSTFWPPYDVIVLDPPYDTPEIVGVIERVGRSGLVARSGLVVLEHSKRLQVGSGPASLRLLRAKRYGDTAVTLWQQEDADGDARHLPRQF